MSVADSTPATRWFRWSLRERDAETSAALLGDRGTAAGAGAPSVTARVNRWFGFGLLGSLTAFLLIWYYWHAFDRSAAARDKAHSAVRAEGESTLPPLTLPARATGAVPPSAPSSAQPTATPSAPVAQPGAASSFLIGDVLGDPLASEEGELATSPDAIPTRPPSPGSKTPAQLALERRLGGRVFVRAGADPARTPAATPPPAGEDAATAAAGPELPDSPAATPQPAPASTALSGYLQGTVTPAAQAAVLPTRRLLLPKGSFIDCTLETAIDSTLPGLATCLTAVDTFSADGKVVLMERGTKLLGETRGELAQGAARIFVLWTEARTPNGVVIPLASPGTDELGRSGLPGKVNRHFLQRFGAAILLTIIDGALQAQQSDGTTIVLNPTGTRDVTTEVLRSTIAIPPTLRKRQGDRIQVLVARDIDFRSVYALHAE